MTERENQMQTLPVLTLRGMTVLPGMLIHLDVSRKTTKSAVEAAMENDGMIFITAQKDPSKDNPSYEDLYEIGVYARIRQQVKLKDDIVRIMISTRRRGDLLSLRQTKPYILGDVAPYDWGEESIMDYAEQEALCRELKEAYKLYLNENPRASRSGAEQISKTKELGRLSDLIAMHINLDYQARQELLECLDLVERAEQVIRILTEEIRIAKIRDDFKSKVREEVDQNQKEYFLREQMKVIRDQLGDEEDTDSWEEKYREQLEGLECSQEVRDRIEKEIKRFVTIPRNSSENVVARDYVETLLALPWDKASVDSIDIHRAEEILEEDHYGLDKVKERILEFLSVRILTGKGDTPIICLVGPPGTGKTSIAKSVARALDKKYERISLGGVRDEAEIRGHRRTYVGALPGRFIDCLKHAGVKNPLILLDEVDKVSRDYRGDTSAALLEVLDPEQNSRFVDHYVDLPVDLSEVLFICTANSLEGIPRPLLDRMEVIRLSGYTENERFHIGKQYLIPKQLEKNGLKKKQLSILDSALKTMISSYTREAGVRELEKTVAKICRKSAKMILADGQDKVKVTNKNLVDFLGKKKHRLLEANRRAEVGIVRGLAWTQVGGDTLEIEVNTMPGDGKLKITGQLGDVMKESALISLSLVRALLPKEDAFFKEHDFHLHVPEGAVPKDGPSAGVTMTTALYSAVTGRKVDPKVAMTGEITLRGKVMPIGGLKEKMLAAKMAGIKTILVPVDNEPDVEEIEDEIKDGLKIVYASKIQTVLDTALL
ncbi:MAG: endopeptidase La [Eubacterium sp.]|nr:endopeptidase La [Eubacterium sp.]